MYIYKILTEEELENQATGKIDGIFDFFDDKENKKFNFKEYDDKLEQEERVQAVKHLKDTLGINLKQDNALYFTVNKDGLEVSFRRRLTKAKRRIFTELDLLDTDKSYLFSHIKKEIDFITSMFVPEVLFIDNNSNILTPYELYNITEKLYITDIATYE